MTAGTYNVTVTATNSAGSATSSIVSAYVFVAPQAPTNVQLTSGDRSLTVNWTRGTDALTTTGYRAQASLAADPFTSVAECTSPAATSCVITGLTQDTLYYVRVTQSNAYATSDPSTSISGTTGQLAQSVSSISLLDSTNAPITVTSNAATVNFDKSPLTIAATLSSSLTPTITSATTSVCTFNSATSRISLLTSGTCSIKVNRSGAGNAFADLTEVTITITVNAVNPSAPVITGVAPSGSGSLRVTWSAPIATGGASITGYTVTATAPGETIAPISGSSTEATFSGLNPGIYTFTVVATNSASLTSVASSSATYSLVVKPSAPTLEAVVTGDRSLVVSWLPSANNGGTSLIGYRVTATTGSTSKSCSTDNVSNLAGGKFTCTVLGLENDSLYTLALVADNGYYLSDPATSITSPAASSWKAGDIPQTVTITGPGPKNFNSAPFVLGASASSALPLTFQSSTTSVCRVDSATGRVEIIKAGDCTITATQSGVGNAYAQASSSITIPIALVAPSAPTVTSVNVLSTGFNVAAGIGQLRVELGTASSLGGSDSATYLATWNAGSAISLTCALPVGNTVTCDSGATEISFGTDVFTQTGTLTFTTRLNDSLSASASTSVTIYRPDPGAPRNVNATVAVNSGISATATWQNPESSGGANSFIDSYEVKLIKVSDNSTKDSFKVRVDSPAYAASPDTTGATTNYSKRFGTRYVYGAVRENGTLSFSIPSGYEINRVAFASYGKPTNSSGTQLDAITPTGIETQPPVWKLGTDSSILLHSDSSTAQVQAAIASNRLTISTLTANNATFGDPWVGQNKTLAVVLELIPTTPLALEAGTNYRIEVTATNSENLAKTMGYNFVTPRTASAPQALAGTPGDTTASLSWSAPLSDGGQSITGYSVTGTGGTATVTGTTASISGLTNGTSYNFTVAAINAVGTSSDVATITITPFGVPLAPASASASVASDSATVTWAPPSSDGGSSVLSYNVTLKMGADVRGSCSVAASAERSCAFGRLIPGDYTVEVIAVNARGNSSAATTTFTIAALSNPITFRTQQSGDTALQSVTANTINVNYGALPITIVPSSTSGQTVTLTASTGVGSGQFCTLSAGVVTINSYSNGGVTENCVITAVTTEPTGSSYANGSSTLTIVVSSVPSSAPRNVTTSISGSNVLVEWLAPTALGGTAITNYTISAVSNTGETVTVTSNTTSGTLTTLDSSKSYAITVKANNASAGSSAATSNVSDSVSIEAVPGTPTDLTAVKDEIVPGRVSVNWTAPSGAAVSTYGVSVKLTASPNTEVGTCTTTGTSCVISGIPTGDYTVTVAGTNGRGTGSAASTTVAVGLTQTINFANASGDSITSLSLPYGSPVTRINTISSIGSPITLSLASGGDYCSITGSNLTVRTFSASGVTTVTCTLQISASATTSFLAATNTMVVTINLLVPDAPASVTLIPGENSAIVNWVAPPSNGGAALTGYKVYYTSRFTDGVPNFTVTSSTDSRLTGVITINNPSSDSHTITGLINGYTYAVKVSALNLIGEGELDPLVTPAGDPGNVAEGVATPGDRSISVSWKAPQDSVSGEVITYGDGGSPITGYEVIATSSAAGAATYSCSVLPTEAQRTNQATVFTCSISVPENKIPYSVVVKTTTAAGTSNTSLGSVTPVATQSITVTTPATADSVVTSINYGSTYQINASASSGLALTFTPSDSTICTVSSSGLLTPLKVGNCNVVISQSGNTIFNPATSVTKQFTINAVVNPSTPTISSIKTNGATFSATLPWGGSDLTPVFRVCTTAETPVCTDFSQSVVTSSSSGALSYTATTLTPNTAYTLVLVATPVTGASVTTSSQSFTTLKTPVITTEIMTLDELSTYSIQLVADATTGTGNFSAWSLTGSLPTGLSLNTNTGVISGTVSVGGSFATNSSGSFTIEVTDSGGNVGSKAYNYTIQGAAQNLSITPIADRQFSTSPISTLVTAPAGATIVFSTTTSAVCAVDSNTGAITLNRDGNCTIAASSAAFNSYRSDSANVTFVVSKAAQTITFADIATQTYSAGGTFSVSANASSGLTLVYSTASSGICSVNASSGLVTIAGAGSCVITANQTPTGDDLNRFNPASPTSQTITIAKATPVIEMTSATSIAYNSTISVTATITEGGALSLTSGDPTKLSVSGTTIQALTGTGTVSLTLTAAESANYLSDSITVTMTLTRASQSITPNEIASVNYILDKEINLTSTATSNLPVSYTSSDLAVATIVSGKIVVKGAGSTTITMSQSGNDDFYLPAPETSTVFTVLKADQDIDLGGFPTSATFGDADRTLTPTNKSTGLSGTLVSNSRSVTLRTTTADVCTLDGLDLQIIGVGECKITGANGGDTNYNALTETFTVMVAKATRTITISTTPNVNNPPVAITYLNETVELAATASADDVDDKSFVVTAGPCSIDGTTLTSTGAGTCSVRVAVAEGGRYLGETQTITISVNKAAQSITNVIRGKELTKIKAPDLPTGAASFSVASVQVSPGDLVTGGADASSSTVVVWLEVVMTDPTATPPADISVTSTISGRVVSTIAALTKGVLPDRELVLVESDRTDNQTVNVLAPQLPENASSYTITSTLAVGTSVQVDDVIAVLTPVGTGPFDPATVRVLATQAGKIASRVAPGTTGVLAAATLATMEPSIKIGEKSAIRATKGPGTTALTYTTTTPTQCSIAADSYGEQRITGLDLGDCVIQISQATDTNYLATSTTYSLLISKGDQQVVVDTVEKIKFSDAPAPVKVEAAAGAAIQIIPDNELVAKVESNKIVPTGVGEVLLEIRVSGTERFNAAPIQTRLIVVEKGEQTLSLTTPTTGKVGELLEVTTSATSKLPVALASLTPEICVIENGKVKVLATGECKVSALQEGSELWEEADPITKSFTTQPGGPVGGGGALSPEQQAAAQALAQKAQERIDAIAASKAARAEAAKRVEELAKARELLATERSTRTEVVDPVRSLATSELPRPSIGNALLLFDGQSTFLTSNVVNGNTLSLTSRGIRTTLASSLDGNTPREIKNDNSLKIVERDFLVLGGSGLRTGSTVRIWIFSNPTQLGTLTVDSTGSYSGKIQLPEDIKVGDHRIQINSVIPDGRVHSLTLGITVEAKPVPPVVQPEPTPEIKKETTRRSVLFARGSVTLDRTEKRLIRSYRPLLQDGTTLSCVAYDAKPTLKRAERRSNLARAKAVCDYLVAKKPIQFTTSISKPSGAAKATRASSTKPLRVDIQVTN